MNINDVRAWLRTVRARPSDHSVVEVQGAIEELRQGAIDARDEALATETWCLETTMSVQQRYQDAFSMLRHHDFYDAWCALERCELDLRNLRKHFASQFQRYSLDFIADAVTRWQELYPYRIFMSPEIVEIEKTCSICGAVIEIRKPCGHRVGEIYGGRLCYRNVTKCEILATSFVESPVQKYSVPFTVDARTGKKVDQYDYSLVRYAVDRLESPFDGWTYVRTQQRHPHSRFRHVGPNAPCPCESGKKYKKCCMRAEGVLRPHYQFEFERPPPPELIRTEFSY